MKVKYHCKTLVLFTICLLPYQKSTSQVESSSELYKTIHRMDSLPFESGFNKCKISGLEPIISEDLEFYHDEGGLSTTKQLFIKALEQNICSNSGKKPLRQLVKGSMRVFPLYNKGVLYGAIQNAENEIIKMIVRENGKIADEVERVQ